MIYIMEQQYRRYRKDKKRMALVMDARNCSILRTELDLNYHGYKALTHYYPRSLQYILIYDLPWILTALYNIVRSWFPPYYKQLIKTITESSGELESVVGLENVPTYLNGKAEMIYPEGAYKCLEVAEFVKQNNMPDAAINQFNSNFSFAIKDFLAYQQSNNNLKNVQNSTLGK